MNLLRNSNFVIILSIILAFLFPKPSFSLKILLIPSLMILMIFSLKRVAVPKFNRKNLYFSLKAMGLNFIWYSSLLLLATLFIEDPNYKIGFMMLAVVPPAIGVIPLTYLTKGDMEKSASAEILSYLFALIFTPIMAYALFGSSVDIYLLLKVLFILIIIPFILSRFIRKVKYDFKEFINIFYSFGLYLALGLSQSKIINEYYSLIPIFLAFIFLKFVNGYFLYRFFRFIKSKAKEIPVYTLFGNFKNGNLALGLVILMFPPEAALPQAVNVIITGFYIVFLLRLFKIPNKLEKPEITP